MTMTTPPNEKEKLRSWMVMNGFSTSDADSFDELLFELTMQVQEMKDQLWSYRKTK